jgi:hypothetical protein
MALVTLFGTPQREPHPVACERLIRSQALERSEARASSYVVFDVHLQPTDDRTRP